MHKPGALTAGWSQTATLATNKVIRNTYTLLSMTLLFSALTAGISMALNLPHPGIMLTLGGYFAYVVTDRSLVIVNLDRPLEPEISAILPLDDGRASVLQFRYLFVTDSTGMRVVDVTNPENPRLVEGAGVSLRDAKKLYVARTYVYVAAGSDGLAIIDVWNPEQPELLTTYNAGGKIIDAHDVIAATTNASLFAYVADGKGGLKVLQLTSPDSQPNFYGFSPEPKPELIASYPTRSAALSLSKGLDRDRGVDETGGQIAIFGRRGSRPLNRQEMEALYLDAEGNPWYVQDE